VFASVLTDTSVSLGSSHVAGVSWTQAEEVEEVKERQEAARPHHQFRLGEDV
jgi:hypothetical protein